MKYNFNFHFFFPVGYMTGILMSIPVGFGFLTGVPVGLADSVKGSPVELGPSRVADRNKFLTASRQEKTVFPVETFLTVDS
jgi:hypothetical protein